MKMANLVLSLLVCLMGATAALANPHDSSETTYFSGPTIPKPPTGTYAVKVQPFALVVAVPTPADIQTGQISSAKPIEVQIEVK